MLIVTLVAACDHEGCGRVDGGTAELMKDHKVGVVTLPSGWVSTHTKGPTVKAYCYDHKSDAWNEER